jgi:hypothetical protein
VERWLPVEGWEDCYAISSQGRVMRIAPGRNTYVGKILRPGITRTGYLHVVLSSGTRKVDYTVHRLVALAFLPPPEAAHRFMVAHRDGNPKNNTLENLYWATPSENNFDARKHGTAKGTSPENRRALTDDDVRKIRQDSRSSEALAVEYGLRAATITQIRRRETHRHVPRADGDYVQENPRYRFTESEVRAIRNDAQPVSQVARAYRVSTMSIWAIRTRRTYAWVED